MWEQRRLTCDFYPDAKKGGIVEVLAVGIPPFADMIGHRFAFSSQHRATSSSGICEWLMELD